MRAWCINSDKSDRFLLLIDCLFVVSVLSRAQLLVQMSCSAAKETTKKGSVHGSRARPVAASRFFFIFSSRRTEQPPVFAIKPQGSNSRSSCCPVISRVRTASSVPFQSQREKFAARMPRRQTQVFLIARCRSRIASAARAQQRSLQHTDVKL